MAFYQITLKDKNGNIENDILREDDSISSARDYAEGRIDGSYGETEWVSVEKVSRITKAAAENLFYGGAISWVNSLN